MLARAAPLVTIGKVLKILAFQAKSFGWRAFRQTLPDALEPVEAEGSVRHAVVAFIHVEADDAPDGRPKKVFKYALKHLKWLANKRDMRIIVLHSFAHLGGENASPGFAQDLLERLAERLQGTGYEVHMTPFGWFSSWNIDVYGDSLAKVFKSF